MRQVMNDALKNLIDSDKARNKENRRTKLYLNLLRREELMGGGKSKLISIIRVLLFDKYCVEISSKSRIGGGLRLPHLHDITVSEFAEIGSNCTIFHQVTIGVNECKSTKKAPRIGDDVYIGVGAKLIGDIVVGNNCIIGANAVVTKNIPDNMIVTEYNKMRGKYENRD